LIARNASIQFPSILFEIEMEVNEMGILCGN